MDSGEIFLACKLGHENTPVLEPENSADSDH